MNKHFILIIIFVCFSFSALANTRVISIDGIATYAELTEQEQMQRASEEEKWLAEKPMRDWQTQMDAIDLSKDFENIIDALDAPTRARIPAETLDKYKTKRSLRLSKP